MESSDVTRGTHPVPLPQEFKEGEVELPKEVFFEERKWLCPESYNLQSYTPLPISKEHHITLLSPPPVPPSPEQSARIGKIARIAQQVLKILSQIWKYIKNPIDPDWRKNQKYRHILTEVARGFHPRGMGYTFAPEAKKGSELEYCHLLHQALKALDGTTPFETERERYVVFATSLERALDTSWYKRIVKGTDAEQLKKIEAQRGEVADLHNLVFALFAQVNTQSFTLSVAKEMAELGKFEGFSSLTAELNVEELAKLETEDQKSVLLQLLDSFIDLVPAASKSIKKANPEHKIAYRTFIGSKIKGGFSYFDFSPLTTGGNPTNIKYVLTRRNPQTNAESDITCLRMASPTVGSQISPLFKGYLRALKRRGLKHAYINLQDRRTPWYQDTLSKQIGEMLGHQNEYLRSRTLEALNQDPEFNEVIEVTTFDKNSSFYQQKPNKKAAKALLEASNLDATEKKAYEKRISSKHEDSAAIQELIDKYMFDNSALPEPIQKGLMQDQAQFREEFLKRVFDDPEGAFHINPDIRGNAKRLIERVGKVCFQDKELLSPLDRQNFIEITYEFLADYLIAYSDSSFFNTSCKDCIDRGGGTNWLKLGTSLLREIISFDKGRNREELEQLIQKLQDLVHKMDEDALWARKREIIDERLFRAIHALKHLIHKAAVNPKAFLHLSEQVFHGDSRKLVLNPQKGQQVQHLIQNVREMKQALAEAASSMGEGKQ